MMNTMRIAEMMNSGFLRSVRHASDHMLVAGADSSTVSTVCSVVSLSGAT